jgi:hypothetical protein
MAISRIDVYGVGQCSLDYLGRITDYPPSDTKCEFRDLTVAGGGPVATALVALSRWGVSTAICGVVGGDAFGNAIRQSLSVEGVGTADLVVREHSDSQFAFIVAETDGGKRTVRRSIRRSSISRLFEMRKCFSPMVFSLPLRLRALRRPETRVCRSLSTPDR